MAVRESNNSFVTLEQARATVGVGPDDSEQDALLYDCINAALSIMEGYTGRLLKERAYTNVFVDGSGTAVLNAPQYPITASATLTVYSNSTRDFSSPTALVLLDSTGSNAGTAQVMVDYEAGILTRIDADVWPSGPGTVLIAAMTAGYQLSDERAAERLRQAQLQITSALWSEAARDPMVASRSIGGLSEQFVAGEYAAMLPRTRLILDAFRRHAWQS